MPNLIFISIDVIVFILSLYIYNDIYIILDVPFPRNFRDIVKQIFKRLFRVYAHIYYSHFHKIVSLGEEAHLNTCFKHFYYFICEFNLVDKKEMQPLQELIDNLTKNDRH